MCMKYIKQKKEWWKIAFSKKYSKIFNKLFPENTEKEIKQIIKWFPITFHKNVLDLACGEGRHAIALSRLGYKVTGIDLSKDFLESASRESDVLSPKPKFVRQDIRTFYLSKKFDLILLIGNSFGYGTDDDQMLILKRIIEHLSNKGLFLLAIPNGLKSICSFEMHGEKKMEYVFNRDKVIVKENYTFDPITSIKSSEWRVSKKGRTIFKQNTVVRFYVASEIIKMLNNVGLSPYRIYGDYQSGIYTKESEFLIVVSKKTKSRQSGDR